MRAVRKHSIVFLGANKGNAERCIDEHVAKGYEVVSMWRDDGGFFALMAWEQRERRT